MKNECINDFGKSCDNGDILNHRISCDSFKCIACKNDSMNSGFDTCDQFGQYQEPLKDLWKYNYVCNECGLIYKDNFDKLPTVYKIRKDILKISNNGKIIFEDTIDNSDLNIELWNKNFNNQ